MVDPRRVLFLDPRANDTGPQVDAVVAAAERDRGSDGCRDFMLVTAESERHLGLWLEQCEDEVRERLVRAGGGMVNSGWSTTNALTLGELVTRMSQPMFRGKTIVIVTYTALDELATQPGVQVQGDAAEQIAQGHLDVEIDAEAFSTRW